LKKLPFRPSFGNGAVKQSQSKPKGTLRLNLSTALGKMYIAPRLAKLAAQYPDLTFNISFNDRISNIIEEGIAEAVLSEKYPAKKPMRHFTKNVNTAKAMPSPNR
jgi:LysR family transcriptional regulator, regulator for bpeEF and oprC